MGQLFQTVLFLVLLNLTFVVCDYCQIRGTSWVKNDDFCYLFVSNSSNRLSYYDAEEYCRSFGAHLVSIHSESENEFIMETMQERRTGGRMWIGLNLLDGEDLPKWSDDTAVDYQKRVGKGFGKKEKCFMMHLSQNGWRSEHCALHYSPICKIRDGSSPTPVPTSTTPSLPTGYCSSGWIKFGQKCYKYFGAIEKDRLKYTEAREACWNLGKGHDLVSIHSMEEQAFLTQHLSDLGTSAWIGISKVPSDEIGHDIVFGWEDNSRNDFSHWAAGHPPRGTWKYCGRLTYDEVNKGEWVADYCEQYKRGYICQKEPDSSVPKPTPPPSKCEEGFKEYRDSCFLYMNQPLTLEKAEDKCKEIGGHVASVIDGFEQAFMYNFLKNESKSVSIGLENVEGTHYLQWIDKQSLYYSNWADGQPRFITGKKSCVFMDSQNDFKWNVTDCSYRFTYVCKKSTEGPSKEVILGRCPIEEYSIDIGDKYCYHVPATRQVLSWYATAQYCLSKGMEMVSLNSDHQTKSLVAYLWRQSWPIHLGLIKSFDKKSFMWLDKSPLNYTNWEDREPSSWFSDRNCVAFSATGGKWSPINCNDGGMALCRTDKIMN